MLDFTNPICESCFSQTKCLIEVDINENQTLGLEEAITRRHHKDSNVSLRITTYSGLH
jgi:hypothetical protein